VGGQDCYHGLLGRHTTA